MASVKFLFLLAIASIFVSTLAKEKFDPIYEIDEKPDLCDNPTIDAIISPPERAISFVFRGAHYWKVMGDNTIVPGYPKLINDTWGLPSHLDTAFIYGRNKIFFFKDSKYWKLDGTEIAQGYPKDIREGFPGIPDSIQAATPWGKKGYIYFFKGKHFWRYEPHNENPVNGNYPKLISDVWRGIPDNLDAAVLYRTGITYFFKGKNYWKLNDETLKVATSPISYPACSAKEWFGCQNCQPSTPHVGENLPDP